MTSAADLIRASQRILVSGHLRADGDSLGAAIALARGLRALGKEVSLLMPDPPDGRYGFLEEETPWQIYDAARGLPEHDLVLVCDCSQLDRLGAMGEEVAAAGKPRIVVDHHPYDPEVHRWDAAWHDSNCAATGLLALSLLRELGVEPDGASLEAAFVALMTDTGWLKYSNADAEAYRGAAELVAGGVDPDRVFRAIYQQTEAGTPRGIGAALRSTEYLADGRIAIGWVDEATLREAGGVLVDTDEVLDILRAVQSVEAVGFLSERNGRVKVSFRSKTWLDVNRVARRCGGGGHARAAGASFAPDVSMDEARARVAAELQAAVEAQAPRG